MDIDEIYMKQVLRLARRGLGRTSPNPAVGALIVKDGQIIGSGYHKKAGAPHAEIEALSLAAEAARDSTLYVNLEPCNHYGRTPPCTKAIVETGIKRVVVGIADPNPEVAGGGCAFLRSQGIAVRCDVLAQECARLNEAYLTYVTAGRPFVILKGALTLDGWMATRTGNSKWITNEKSRKFVHTLRKRVDAVMVGVVVVDTHLRIPLDSKVFDSGTSAFTIIAAGSKVSTKKRKRIEELGARIIPCRVRAGRIDLVELLGTLAKMSISSILVEGGATLFDTFVREGIVDKFHLFFAPKILGGDDGVPFTRGAGCDIMKNCLSLTITTIKRFGDDVMIEAYPQR
jgi:diaminohydroxyphosphoribosylaminopyrimidine deaminase/5-amino-6-(5-phosphoribosylamino)uracil reductase